MLFRSISYRAPLAITVAEAFWGGVAAEVASGRRVLLVAWCEGALAGTVQLNMDSQQNQPHRAEVEKLLVAPAHRRQGLGRALLARASQAAARLNKSLLTLDVRAGTAGEALYRAEAWQETGRIPACEFDEHDVMRDVVLFWKEAR